MQSNAIETSEVTCNKVTSFSLSIAKPPELASTALTPLQPSMTRLSAPGCSFLQVESEGPLSFLDDLNNSAGIDAKTLKFCYDRLHSLMLTLEITDTEEFHHLTVSCAPPTIHVERFWCVSFHFSESGVLTT
jgi:hypothetical protein